MAGAPLKGVKVLDLTTSGTGEMTTKYFGDHGADVVWVESVEHVDISRASSPYRDGIVDPDHSSLMAAFCTSKYSLGLNMTRPGAREVARRLVTWADVIIQSYRPGVMEKWGLGYEQVSRWKPQIIMASISIHGQTGPRSAVPGWGYVSLGMQGLPYYIGWPDRSGVSPPIAYVDSTTPWYAVAAILGALDYRNRTGKGQHIDFSQAEAALTYVPGVYLLDYFANGNRRQRSGNRSDYAAPHGVYPCRGQDRWCAISVFTDKEWTDFCSRIGVSWTNEDRFATSGARKRNEDELDRLVASWTVAQAPEDVMRSLQGAGIACGVVQDCQDLMDRDPQLAHRHYWWSLERPGLGECRSPAWPGTLSKTPCHLRPSPRFEEHTVKVCQEFLGMADEQIADLIAEGVLEVRG